ncbi:hypothetical protein RHOER0001_1561 [Rhodococcus erythropolis SK121]|nr:hypothetical protein RHOER0001_1561 [Rhodococcus erythropolis SK121]
MILRIGGDTQGDRSSGHLIGTRRPFDQSPHYTGDRFAWSPIYACGLVSARDGRPGVSMVPGLTASTWHSRFASANCIFSTRACRVQG